MKRRADYQAGYVLHTYPYKETSLIVEAFTRNFGRVALLARGARRPPPALGDARPAALLPPVAPGLERRYVK